MALSLIIVEDENIVAMTLRRQLEAFGFRVLDLARTGEAAIEKVALHRPDIVLMDIRLAGAMDGIAAAETLRLRFNTPVIFLTAYSDAETLERAKAVEPYGYILKPVATEELRVVTEVAVGRHRAQQLLAARTRQQTALVELGRSALVARPLDDLLQTVATTVETTLGASVCVVAAVGDGGIATPLAARGWQGGSHVALADLWWEAWPPSPASPPPLLAPGTTPPPALRAHGVETALAAPIGAGIPFGMLVAGATGHAFTADDAGFVRAVADIVAQVLLRERIAEERMRYLDRLQQAQEALRNANAELEARVRERTAELSASESRFRDLAESMPQTVWTARPDGTIDYFNRRWLETGTRVGDNHGWRMVVHPEDRADTEEAWRHSIATGEPYQIEHRIHRADGSHVWMLSRAVPVRDHDGRVTAWYGTSTDIDHSKRLQQELEATNAELEEFASVTSHDLKEPLRSVAIHLDLLARRGIDALSEDQRRHLRLAVEGAARMSELIDSLLRYLGGEGGGNEAPLTAAGEALALAIADLEPEIEASGARIEAGPLPEVRFDRTQLARVFQNLLSNAIKYRGPDPPVVRVTATADDALWTFAVSDNGIGIAPQDTGRIFAVFRRLHRHQDIPGTGIGLAICRKLIERAGGTIRVESSPGHGATFLFTVPRRSEERR